MKMNRVLIMILGLVLVVYLSACQLNLGSEDKESQGLKLEDYASDDQSNSLSDPGYQNTIGLSFDSLVVERWQRDMEIIVAEANEAGYGVNVQIANEDVTRQKEQINALIDEGVKVLIILPNDAGSLVAELERAKRLGIKVIAYDRLITGGPVDLYLSFDNFEIGRQLATRLLTELKGSKESTRNEYNLVIINGDPKDNNSTMLNQGFYKSLDPDIEAGDVNILHEVWANGWRERYADEAVRKVLSENKKVDGIIAANDVLAASAIRVLAEYELAGQVKVVSQDAELSACQRIVEGSQLATVYKPINTLAQRAVVAAVAFIEGRAQDVVLSDGGKENEIKIDNLYANIPFDKQSFTIVDAGNIDQVIIESGFHAKEDVYRHKP